MPTGLPSDIHGQQYPHHPHLTMPAIENMAPPMKPPGTETFPQEAKSKSCTRTRILLALLSRVADSGKVTATRAFEYGHSGMTNWMSADAGPGSSKSSDMNWRYPAEPPISLATPAFSPYAGGHGPPPSEAWSSSVGGELSAREDMAWPSYTAPARSMSFGSDSMANQHHDEYSPMSQHHSSRHYAPPNTTTIPGIETVPGTALDHHVPLSAGAAVPSPHYSTWPQYSYAKPGESYATWYAEGAQQQPLGQGGAVHHSSEHHSPGGSIYYTER